MNAIDANASGQFRSGGIKLNRLCRSAQKITGSGDWAASSDRNAAVAMPRRLPEVGVNFIDTADSDGSR